MLEKLEEKWHQVVSTAKVHLPSVISGWTLGHALTLPILYIQLTGLMRFNDTQL